MNTRAGSSRNKQSSVVFPSKQLINDRYLLLEQIGEGGFAVVYRAKDEEEKRLVAIKFLMLPQIPGHVERFEREAKLHQALEGPGILPFHDYGSYTGADDEVYPYCVLQYIPGGDTLNDLIYYYRNKHSPSQKIQGTCVPIAIALDLFYQISVGVGHAHSQEVIHRDLKPSNVLLQDDGSGGKIAHVMDFGIAAPIASRANDHEKLTLMNMIMGTPHYMSPQQCLAAFRDDANVRTDLRNDIWSFGVLMFETLTGQPPFPEFDQIHDTKIIEQLISHKYKRIYIRDICDGLGDEFDELIELVEQCLEYEIEDRPQNMLQIQTRIHKIRSKLGSSSMRVTPIPMHISAIRKDSLHISSQLAETLVAPSTPPRGAVTPPVKTDLDVVVCTPQEEPLRQTSESDAGLAVREVKVEPPKKSVKKAKTQAAKKPEKRPVSSKRQTPKATPAPKTSYTGIWAISILMLLIAGAFLTKDQWLPLIQGQHSVATVTAEPTPPVPAAKPVQVAPMETTQLLVNPPATSTSVAVQPVPTHSATPDASTVAVATTAPPTATFTAPPPTAPPTATHKTPPRNTRSYTGPKEIPGVDYFPSDNGPVY